MKKFLVIVFTCLLLVGCGSSNKVDSSNRDSNSSSNTNSNTNTNVNSNTNTNSNTNEDEDPNVGKYPVDLYLFHLSTCPHCQAEIAWLESIASEYPYLHVHYYEANESEDLYYLVKEKMGITTPEVPLNILGNSYFTGFSEAKERKIIRMIKEQSTVSTCDVVGTIIEGGDYQACMKKNEGE